MHSENFLADWATVDEFCATVQICRKTADRWARKRYGPARVKLSRKIYYRKSAVDEFLRSQEELFTEVARDRNEHAARQTMLPTLGGKA
jgi:hypothetical protein